LLVRVTHKEPHPIKVVYLNLSVHLLEDLVESMGFDPVVDCVEDGVLSSIENFEASV